MDNKEETLIEINLNEFINDLNELFCGIYDKILQEEFDLISQIIEKFKFKYQNLRIDKYNCDDDIENKIIKIFQDFQIKCENNNKHAEYLNIIFELYEFLFKLYNKDKFINFNSEKIAEIINFKNNYSEDDSISIFKTIGNTQKEDLNSLIDNLVSNLLKESNEGRALFITNNLLIFHKNISSFISIKIIVLNLIIFKKIKNNNHKFFSNCLTNIATILIPESDLFSKKMNLEFYDNQFSEFEFNGEDKDNRRLNQQEFNFLLDNFFLFIKLIINTLQPENISNLSNLNFKLYEIIENSIEIGKTKIESEEEINIYKIYLLICLICDVIEFIFSHLHYLDEKFKAEEEIKVNINPFLVYKDKIQPKFYDNFINIILELILKITPNIVTMIEIFMKISNLKSLCENKISTIEKNEESSYFIFEPFNPVGFSTLIYIIWKKQKENLNLPLNYSNLYLLDHFLPICSVLIKRSENFKFMGLEFLFNLIEIFNEEILHDMRYLKNYSYEDVFKDLLQFIGGSDPETKRIFICKNILKFIRILSNDAKKELFIFTLKDILKENNNVNDAEACFIIYTLKNLLTEEIKNMNLNQNYNNNLFNETFLKEIIDLSVNENLFVIDILETISQGLNFTHFLIIQDKTVFNKSLNIYNKTYLYKIEKKIDIISNLIEKWVRSDDQEKMKHVRVDTSDFNMITDLREKKEELQKSFDLRKNQAMISLHMVGNVKKLISDYLKNL